MIPLLPPPVKRKIIDIDNSRQPLHTIHPKNAPTVVAGVVYRDPTRGLLFHSIRKQGIHQRTNAIQIDADVLDQLDRLGCNVVSVATNGHTYTTTTETIRHRGRWLTTTNGTQIALHVKHWHTNGLPVAEPATVATTTHNQMSLFEGAR